MRNRVCHVLNDEMIQKLKDLLDSYVYNVDDLDNVHFDLVQFEIDVCKVVYDFIVKLGCKAVLSKTHSFLNRGRSTIDRNIKKP